MNGVLLPVTPAAAAPGDPFDPNTPTIFVAQETPTRLYQAVQGTGAITFTTEGPASAINYNAIGFNTLDNYLYGVRRDTGFKNALQRIGQDGQITGLGPVTGLPVPSPMDTYNQGTFGSGSTAGILYVRGQQTPTQMWAVNVAAMTATSITLSSGVPNVSDIVWKDGFIWGMNGPDDRMYRIDPATGQVQSWLTGLGFGGPDAFGAQWLYGNGNLGFSDNTTGVVYQVAVSNPTSATPGFTLISSTPGPSSANNDGASVPGAPVDLGIAKSGPAQYSPGGAITYTLTVTNDGPGNSSGSIVSDGVPAGITGISAPGCVVAGSTVTCAVGALLSGASTTITISGTVAAGATTPLSNTATVTGNELDPVTGNNSSQWTSNPPAAPSPSISVVKSASTAGPVNVGDAISYTFVVTNTGNVTLTSVSVSDPFLTAAGISVSCPVSMLAAGATTSCSSSQAYVVTAADAASGSVQNTATASGTPPTGGPVASAPSTVSVPTVVPAPGLSIVKSNDAGNAPLAVNQVLTYSFVVTNTGNTLLTGVVVNEVTFTGAGSLGAVSCPSSTLVAGASMTCAASYTVVQADVDAGVLNNTATASGTPPVGGPVTSAPSSSSVPSAANPSMSVVKSASTAGPVNLGDAISYSFMVTNTGNVTLNSVSVSDPFLAGAGISVSCPVSTLAPGGTTTCVASQPYVVAPADVVAGSVENTATASGTPPLGGPVTSGPSTVTLATVAPAPGLSIVKSNDGGSGALAVGQVLTYSFVVTNTGNVALSAVVVNEVSFSGAGSLGPVSCPVSSLAVGGSTTCTASYSVVQADVDAGVVNNTATASGMPPVGGPVTSAPSSSSVPSAANPSMSVVKSASTAGPVNLGDSISYSFVVTNTGNVTLTAVQVSDPKAGAVTCPAGPLGPGVSVTCTANAPYVVTQGDVDAGVVLNVAAASGLPPVVDPANPPARTVSEPDDNEVPTTSTPSMAVVKAGVLDDESGNGTADLGETIAYSFEVTNTGTVTVTAVQVSDPKVGAVTCPAGPLSPGATVTCTADAPYVVTQDDVDAGVVLNVATASGLPPVVDPANPPARTASEPAEDEVPTTDDPAVSLTKSGLLDDEDGNGTADVGESITYTFEVTNNGTVTLTALQVSDPKAGTVTCPAGPVAPGESITCTADAAYAVTQADVDAGMVLNVATASGLPPVRDPLNPPARVDSDPAEEEVPTTYAPALTLTKDGLLTDGNGNGTADVGETITYSFVVSNSGNVTITDVQINDPKAGAVTCQVGPLAPGESMDCLADAPYVVTQADVDAGSVDNVATASGLPPVLDPENPPTRTESEPATDQVPTTDLPAVSVVKSGVLDDSNGNGTADAGEMIAYSFAVTNTGTVTLTDLQIDDPMVGPVTCPIGPLAPGEVATCTADSTYSVTQADVDAGVVFNSATVSGLPPVRDPQNPPTRVESDPSENEVLTAFDPAVAIVKSGVVDDENGNGTADVGETIDYSFEVTNSGNVTLTEIQVIDPKVGTVTCPAEPLSPGQSLTCTADGSYVVAQADVDAGVVLNVATAAGLPPVLDPENPPTRVTSDPVEHRIPVPAAAPSLSLVKSAVLNDRNGQGTADAGETIAYSFLVTNTGSVTLTGVGVNDPKLGAVTCPVTVLAPGARTSCTGDALYVVTAADVASGAVRNVATAAGLPPGSATVILSRESAVVVAVTAPAPTPHPAPRPLPNTGVKTQILAPVALILVFLGGAALIAARRRETTR